MFYLFLFSCFLCTIFLTPLFIKVAHKIGALDYPGNRKIHTVPIPRLGGLSIYFSFCFGVFFIFLNNMHWAIIFGSVIITATGVLDDIYDLSVKTKLLSQITSAMVVILLGGIQIEFINLPFGGQLDFGIFSILITVIWIVGIINAINFIDGLDGLAAGVSSIALFFITIMSSIQGNIFVMTMGLILISSTLPFLLFNFYPAKVFMGDTGAMFLGYIIAVLSILGFKNITFISLIIPIVILGVPIFDIIFSIVRRVKKKVPIGRPDKSHIHHCFLHLGFTHKQTVLIIYAISALFGAAGLLLSLSTVWVSLGILVLIVLIIELLVEGTGLIDKSYRPILNLIRIYGRKE